LKLGGERVCAKWAGSIKTAARQPDKIDPWAWSVIEQETFRAAEANAEPVALAEAHYLPVEA
jgi:hypothetical protein